MAPSWSNAGFGDLVILEAGQVGGTGRTEMMVLLAILAVFIHGCGIYCGDLCWPCLGPLGKRSRLEDATRMSPTRWSWRLVGLEEPEVLKDRLCLLLVKAFIMPIDLALTMLGA